MAERKKLCYGMVGGGLGAFIGAVHRKAIALEETADLVAGCFSSKDGKNQETGSFYGIEEDRLYKDYREMAQKEAKREDGIDFVSITRWQRPFWRQEYMWPAKNLYALPWSRQRNFRPWRQRKICFLL